MKRSIQLVIGWRRLSILWARCPYCRALGGARLPDEAMSPHVEAVHPL